MIAAGQRKSPLDAFRLHDGLDCGLVNLKIGALLKKLLLPEFLFRVIEPCSCLNVTNSEPLIHIFLLSCPVRIVMKGLQGSVRCLTQTGMISRLGKFQYDEREEWRTHSES